MTLIFQRRLIGSLEKTKQRIARSEFRPDSVRSLQGALHPVLQLHRTLGNQRVAQLIQAKRVTPHGKITGLQRKLTVGGALPYALQQSGAWQFATAYTTNERRLPSSKAPITELVARQPNPDPGWSDAPKKGLNEWVTTVDEKGNIVPGKGASKGVWRVPIEGLGISYLPKKGEQGPAFESPKGKAVALIPNIVTPTAPEKEKTVQVDVLLHLHGHGVGYRELKPGKQDAPGVLKPGQLRDVELYQMEQQLLSHVTASKRLLIAVLPQGSEKSDFGNLSSNSGAYLTDVFAKLIPKYLPNGAIPGRVIVSGHSGGGPTAMAVAIAEKRKDVMLFDAINDRCTEKVPLLKNGQPVIGKDGNPKMTCNKCETFEYGAVRDWVKKELDNDKKSVDGKPEAQQIAELKANGTRFRGYTSQSLTLRNNECGYGHWYKKLKTDIETKIKNFKVSAAVANQLHQNYQVQEAKGLTGFKGNEPHERVMGQGNLEAALKD